MRKLDNTKVMRDPIHSYIHVDYAVVWEVIGAKEFQRLRRIHQLGGIFQVYHTAEHSRFGHSLGVYEIVRRMCFENTDINENLSEYDKVCVMLAGLLHDVGHGPFSHAFEAISRRKHEEYTIDIIVGNSDINQILNKYGDELAKDVASIISYTHPNPILRQIISGQLDADRMDYLLRDAYFTGTSYGNFDLERILRTFKIADNKLVVKESGIHAVEDYIMARYHMYWQVYYHPIARAYEALLHSIFKKMKVDFKENPQRYEFMPLLLPYLRKEVASIQNHYLLDENALMYAFSHLSQSGDEVLSDLCDRLINRRLFEYVDYTDELQLIIIKNNVAELGYDLNYYVKEDHVNQRPYRPYRSDDNHNIWVLKPDHTIEELSKVSSIVAAIAKAKPKEDRKIFYPTK